MINEYFANFFVSLYPMVIMKNMRNIIFVPSAIRDSMKEFGIWVSFFKPSNPQPLFLVNFFLI